MSGDVQHEQLYGCHQIGEGRFPLLKKRGHIVKHRADLGFWILLMKKKKSNLQKFNLVLLLQLKFFSGRSCGLSGEAHLLADAVLHVLLAGGRGKSKPAYGFVLRGMYQKKSPCLIKWMNVVSQLRLTEWATSTVCETL